MINSANTQSTNPERASVKEWLSRSFTWCIPVYQRHYAWTSQKDQSGTIDLLWRTIEEHAKERLSVDGKGHHPHYLGAIIVDNKTPKETTKDGMIYEVVDGQQRLTTISIALCALVAASKEFNKEEDTRSSVAKYIFSDDNRKISRLQPTNFDKERYEQALFYAFGRVPDLARKGENDSKIVNAFEFFEDQFKSFIKEHHELYGLTRVIQAIRETLLDGLDLIVIALKDHDDAQIIFESINNTKTELTTFDLIRNYVFYRASNRREDVVDIYGSDNWRTLEERFWEGKSDKKNTHIESYIARMLVAKLKKDFKFDRNSIVSRYKEFTADFKHASPEITEVVEYVEIYKYLVGETDGIAISQQFDCGVFHAPTSKWTSKDFYPLIFLALTSEQESQEQQDMIKLLESFVIRRAVCGLTDNRYNLVAHDFCVKLGAHLNYNALLTLLKESKVDTSKFPSDLEVKDACGKVNFFDQKLKHYIFAEIEKFIRLPMDNEETTINKGLSIDHILPQGWKEDPRWIRSLLGDDVPSDGDVIEQDAQHIIKEQVINSIIHTIGNLTLMGGKRNSSKSNNPFDDVKDLLQGSSIKMNQEIAKLEQWGPTQIGTRSAKLADIIIKRWPMDIVA